MEENGIIVVNKEMDMTSHDCVNIIRRVLKMKRVGHTGTLDPMATGVLPVCIGKATKIADYISFGDKEYIAEFKLGIKTDTLDITGEITATSDKKCKKEEVEEVIKSFLGVTMQIPPMYSAKKVQGKKLYELAREGIEITRDPVEIEIKEIEILKNDIENNVISIRVLCSKGTYIRSLIDDIGEKLGTYAVMTSLKRTKSGIFSIEDERVIGISDIKKGNFNLSYNLIKTDKLFEDYRSIVLPYNLEMKFKNGIYLNLNELGMRPSDVALEDIFRVYGANKEFLALGVMISDNKKLALKVKKSFY